MRISYESMSIPHLFKQTHHSPDFTSNARLPLFKVSEFWSENTTFRVIQGKLHEKL